MTTVELGFFARLWLAFLCWFRVLFSPRVAAAVRAAIVAGEASPVSGAVATARSPGAEPSPSVEACQLLGLLQREGRLVDFVRQDLAGFTDADVASAARVVHDGCRRALAGAVIEPCRAEPEGAVITLDRGFDAQRVKVTGNVRGEPPYRGTLRHRGWRVARLELPQRVGDARGTDVLQPAEVEL